MISLYERSKREKEYQALFPCTLGIFQIFKHEVINLRKTNPSNQITTYFLKVLRSQIEIR